jgi:hypothetical protein
VTLMRFDTFRELDRLAEHTLSVGARALHSMPMEALRRGDEFILHLDEESKPRRVVHGFADRPSDAPRTSSPASCPRLPRRPQPRPPSRPRPIRK